MCAGAYTVTDTRTHSGADGLPDCLSHVVPDCRSHRSANGFSDFYADGSSNVTEGAFSQLIADYRQLCSALRRPL